MLYKTYITCAIIAARASTPPASVKNVYTGYWFALYMEAMDTAITMLAYSRSSGYRTTIIFRQSTRREIDIVVLVHKYLVIYTEHMAEISD